MVQESTFEVCNFSKLSPSYRRNICAITWIAFSLQLIKIMRRLFPFAIALILLSTGCEKVEDLTKFDIEYNSVVEIPSSTPLGDLMNLYTPPVESNSESKFESNDTRKDLIEEIILTDLTLTINSPQNGNFDFLESIFIYINADGLDELEVASKQNIQDGSGKTLTLTTSNEDLQAFIKQDSFTLRVRTVTDQTMNQNHEINVQTVFAVDAKLKS